MASKTASPLISIVIPVKNGERTIQKCLESIYTQTLIEKAEVIIIDSGSTDNTLEIIRQYPVRLYQIPPEEFNHGKTRNNGVSVAKGEFVVMTVQDARAATNDWLEIMLRHFKDNNVVAVVGQQAVPHEREKNPHQWYRPVNKPRIVEVFFKNSNDYRSLSGKDQDSAIFYDDVNSMYRKSALCEMPFDQIMFGEDMKWVKKAVENGHKIIYDTHSRVWHYHHQTPDYVYQRICTVCYFKYITFNYLPYKKIRLTDYFRVLYINLKFKTHPKWVVYNISILNAQKRAYEDMKNAFCLGAEHLHKFYKANFKSVVQGIQN